MAFMSIIRQVVREKLLALVGVMPYGRDVYLRMTKNRRGINYRGVFSSYEQALQRVSRRRTGTYDIVNANKAIHVDQEKKSLDDWFHSSDYPVLYWLAKSLASESMVLELGGSVGHFFYSIQRYFSIPAGVTWTIAELPEAVKLGREIAGERGENRLSFVVTDEIEAAGRASVFLTAGTLQYMREHLCEVLGRLDSLPEHVLVHNLPTHSERSFWTLQDLGLCEVPYRVYARTELLEAMQGCGYELKAQWSKPRTIEIPFHRGLTIEGYLGYYFANH